LPGRISGHGKAATMPLSVLTALLGPHGSIGLCDGGAASRSDGVGLFATTLPLDTGLGRADIREL
jgi:hypothetical protein